MRDGRSKRPSPSLRGGPIRRAGSMSVIAIFRQLSNRLHCNPMKPRLWAFTIAILLASVSWCQDQQKPLVLLVEPADDHPAYHLDSLDVSANPLRGLGLAIEKKGKDWPLTIAVDSRLSINTLWNAGALAGKAGFVNIRYYAFHHENRKMIEVSFGRELPTPTQTGSH
jgi:hypothetical protein